MDGVLDTGTWHPDNPPIVPWGARPRAVGRLRFTCNIQQWVKYGVFLKVYRVFFRITNHLRSENGYNFVLLANLSSSIFEKYCCITSGANTMQHATENHTNLVSNLLLKYWNKNQAPKSNSSSPRLHTGTFCCTLTHIHVQLCADKRCNAQFCFDT